MGGGVSRDAAGTSSAAASTSSAPVPAPGSTEELLGGDEMQGIRCPITQQVMSDPVSCADGHTYERAAIEEWLARNHRSPLTNAKLAHKKLVPNHALRGIIEERKQIARRQATGTRAAASAPRPAGEGDNVEAGGGNLRGDGGSSWRINPASLEMTPRVLGRGAWGVVRLGHLTDSNGDRTAVAVKILPEAPSSVTDNLEQEFHTIAFATIRCAHVCRLIGTCAVEGTIALVMKRYECTLHDLLEGAPDRKLPLSTVLRVGAQLAHAVGELHEHKIVLRDLKPSNVLLDKWGSRAYGWSRTLDVSIPRAPQGACDLARLPLLPSCPCCLAPTLPVIASCSP